jgi:DNA-binding response OmpR family regulator
VPELKVLAVEHDPPLRELYDSLLAERGHRVRVATNGREALEQLSPDIDVIVVDLRSHKSEGRAVLEAISHQPLDQRPPVLIVDGDDEAAAFVTGPHTMVLRKPFDLQRFVEAVEALANIGRPKRN